MKSTTLTLFVHASIIACFACELCSCSAGCINRPDSSDTDTDGSCVYTEYTAPVQYRLVYVTDEEENGNCTLNDLQLEDRAVELNRTETQIIKECIQFYSLWNKPWPTCPSNWCSEEMYWVMSNDKRAFLIGEHGENALIGLISPFFWHSVKDGLKGAMRRAKAKAVRCKKE